MLRAFLFGIILVGLSWNAQSQTNPTDSIFLMTDATIAEFQAVSTQDPFKAAFFSAILPGLGQAYNNQYWKIPLIYGGGLIFAHYIEYNHRIYQEMQNALIAETDLSPNTINYYKERFVSAETLGRNRDAFRRNRDLLIILTSAFYLLNVVDAHVSAHLNEFDVNENLSMSIFPAIHSSPLISRTAGFSVSLNFK
jgi:hypothetical protein